MRTCTCQLVLGFALVACGLAAPVRAEKCKDTQLREICGTDEGEEGRPASAGGAQSAWSAEAHSECYGACKDRTCKPADEKCMLNGVSRKEGVQATPIRREGKVVGFEFCAAPTCKCRCDRCAKDAALKIVPRASFRGAGGTPSARRLDARDRAKRWCAGEADGFTPGPGHGECKRFPCPDNKTCVAAEAIGRYEEDGFVLEACKCKCE